MKMRMMHTKGVDDMAKELIGAAGSVKVWLFFGEMGSGKTTLIQRICSRLGVRDRVSSPTFTLINEYRGEQETRIYHVDLYRLKDSSEVHDIGLEERLYSGAYCFVEWPQITAPLLPDSYLKVYLYPFSSTERILDYTLTHYDREGANRL